MERQHDQRAPGAVAEPPETLQQRMSFAWNHVGGLSGAVLTTVPVLAFVIVNAVYGMWIAIWSSLAGAVLVGAVQVLRREKLTAAFAGLGGSVLSSVITVVVGEAKGRYLWGIWVALAIGVVLLVLVLVRRPLIGLVWAGLNFQDNFWRTDRRARFYYDVTTLFWSALCFLRFGVQFWLYIGDRTTALGFTNVLMGTPLTFASVLVTIWAVRKVDKRRKLLRLGTYYLANSQFAGHPNMPLWRNRTDSERTGRQTAQALGCDRIRHDRELACLRATPAEALQKQPGPFLPTYGTRILPEEPLTALKAGHFNKVPVLNGATWDEGRFFARRLPSDMTADHYRALLHAAFGQDARAVESRYPAGNAPRLAWARVMTDRTFAVPTMETNSALARHVPTYGFEFRDRRAPNYLDVLTGGLPLGAYHSADVPYLIGVTGATARFTPQQRRLSDQMIGYWTRFAEHGSPNGAGLPRWPAFDATARNPHTQGLAPAPEGTGPVHYAEDHQLAFWKTR